MVRQWFVRQRWGLAIGASLTLAAVGLHLLGLTETLELQGFDFHVRHFSRIPPSDRIVHIDINDDALDRIGSWPWPRDIQAELIRILNELGAERIVIDIVWAEPKPGEVRLPTLDPYADIEGEIEMLGELSEENIVVPDDELAGAIAEADQVYLAMYFQDSEVDGEHSALSIRLADLLREDFGLDAAALSGRLGEKVEAIESILAGVKRRVARELVKKVLAANPSAGARQVHKAILSTPFNSLTKDRVDILAAYHRELGIGQLRSKCPLLPEVLRGKLPRAKDIIPPVYKFTAGAQGVGFATFAPDFDGRTRHVPLLMEWDGRLIEQLAFTVIRDVLDIRVEDLAIDESGDLRIAARRDRPAMRVQLDDRKQMLINWHVSSKQWTDCFKHLPVTQLLRIYDCRRRMKENDVFKQMKIAEAIRIVKDDAGFELYRRQVNKMLKLQRQVRWAKLQGRDETDEIKAARAEADRLRRIITSDQNETLAFIKEQWAELKAESNPNDPEIAGDYKRFETASRLISEDVANAEQQNREIAAEQQKLIAQFKPMIENKICFIGYTATAVADMINVPPYKRMPGVLVHSNVLNDFLQNQFLTWSRLPTRVAVIVLFGLLTTILTTTHGPRSGLVFVMMVIIASLTLNASGLFEKLDYWLWLLTAVTLAFVVWAIIVMLRYLTTEREKRRFSKAVAQYVSPAMAKRIAETASNLDLAPVNGVVTCFFSDLRGFTPISERLGPEGTKTLLNPYLEVMSGVLHRHQALINKFMGDGIFAFFNPPILPCAEHAIAACEAALDSQQALRELTARFKDHPLSEEFARLFMRIGITSGPVFVGDYGSENKMDYTCMGDTVNLAARLESANKVFGSATMLSGSTYDAVGNRYRYRRLGLVQVKGQTVGVPIYELLGRPGQVDGQIMRFADTFDEAVAAFARRDWSRSSTGFEKCLELRTSDPGSLLYLNTIRRCQDNPPPDDWNAAIELTEK